MNLQYGNTYTLTNSNEVATYHHYGVFILHPSGGLHKIWDSLTFGFTYYPYKQFDFVLVV